MLIKEAESYGLSRNHAAVAKLLPFATEAAWATGRWDALENYVAMAPKDLDVDFNVNVGRLLLLLKNNPKDTAAFEEGIDALREHIASSLTEDSTSSLTKCRDQVLRFHALTELETIGCTARYTGEGAKSSVVDTLNRRLEVVGAYLKDKQYLLGLRRAAMSLSRNFFKDRDIASLWMSTARLAREENSLHFAYNAVLHATKLGDDSATIEHARLLWKEGNQRKAINSLEGAIIADAFMPPPGTQKVSDATSRGTAGAGTKNQPLKARAYLLLAKWLDEAGQTQTAALRKKYQEATAADLHWEKGHYYLGRHYNKLLETEKAEKPEQQSQAYLTGETSKLVIENYLRALKCGTKYVYQTLPRIITLWLDLGMLVRETPEQKVGDRSFYATLKMTREDQLKNLHHKIEAYLPKIPAYIWYTALSQMLSRIAHPNQDVFKHLQKIIVKVIVAHPQHALWNLLAVTVSNQLDRKTRGGTILLAVKNTAAKSSLDIGSMIQRGQKLSKELLNACVTGTFESNKTCWVGLVKDLGFRPREACPNQLAVPIQSVLTATLPTLTGTVRGHKAFSRDVITIHSFEEQVMVLSSLAKPRKVTVRGSDGRKYGLLLKPKDDLRKDQRLMEFNGMINRSLKRDAESSKRQLYIRTYAVTPLNEECGIIEWVDGLRTHRDIIFEYYKQHNVIVNYAETKNFCDQAMRDPELLEKFGEEVLAKYPPMFHLWFVKQFPEPSVWFNARLRYTRSCAVMSMIGTILGLGDRHTENILVEEGNGGIFHVDFNCLFDKGLTFQQPERVPFRLTQNMRDAMGVYQHEGPFRKTCELTLKLLRQHEETLMTILEAFVYDPTLDFIEDKRKRKRETKSAVPDTPYAVLVAIKRKIRGLLQEETIPLGVEGQVDELIRQATSWKNLASMYIGWCSFM
jgi:serine/threonine-protein kinase ATR